MRGIRNPLTRAADGRQRLRGLLFSVRKAQFFRICVSVLSKRLSQANVKWYSCDEEVVSTCCGQRRRVYGVRRSRIILVPHVLPTTAPQKHRRTLTPMRPRIASTIIQSARGSLAVPSPFLATLDVCRSIPRLFQLQRQPFSSCACSCPPWQPSSIDDRRIMIIMPPHLPSIMYCTDSVMMKALCSAEISPYYAPCGLER